MEIRPSHGVHGTHSIHGTTTQGPARALLGTALVVKEVANPLFVDTIPNNDNAAKAQRGMKRKATEEPRNRDAHKADHKMDEFTTNKSIMSQANQWNPSAPPAKRHKH